MSSWLPIGLEAQLLGIVVRKERPELEEQKDRLVVNIAEGKKKLADLEDEILRYETHTTLINAYHKYVQIIEHCPRFFVR